MKEWARQQIAEKQRLEAAQAGHAQELARLKAENDSIKAQAEADQQKAERAQRQASAVAWVAANQKQIVEELTKAYQPSMQRMLEAYKFKGEALAYFVEEAALDGKVLYFSQLLIWQKPDGSGCVARIIFGQNIETNQFVYDKVLETKDIPREELAHPRSGNQNQTVSGISNKPSVWAPTNETVNSGYQAAIKLAATAAGIAIMNALSGN